ncbi:MAG: response regulator [Thermoplasmatales archaeon]|nr:MAG: response regulator [Thermoplasmatales archaeon]
MDLMMPYIDGWETLKEIIKKGLNKDIVISILTAKGAPDPEKMKGFDSYIYNYIKKPFELKKLISEINGIAKLKK